MSLAAVTSSPSLPTRKSPAVSGGRAAILMRALGRRRHVAAQQAHERESQTDAYVDRYGTVELDVASLAAFVQR